MSKTGTKALTGADFLNSANTFTELVPHEVKLSNGFEGTIYLKPMTAAERDALEIAVTKEGFPKEWRTSELVRRCMCDEKGNLLLPEQEQTESLSTFPAGFIAELFAICTKISGTVKDQELINDALKKTGSLKNPTSTSLTRKAKKLSQEGQNLE